MDAKTDGELLAEMGTDATKWAEAMSAAGWGVVEEWEVHTAEPIAAAAPILDATPGGWLHGWLCNAIEAGRAAGARVGRDHADDEAEAVERDRSRRRIQAERDRRRGETPQ